MGIASTCANAGSDQNRTQRRSRCLACRCDSGNSFSTARRAGSPGVRSRFTSRRRHSRRAVQKKELMDRLWPDVVVEEANLKNLVAEIRNVTGADTIRTVPRYGYAFAAADSGEAKTVARLIQGDRVHRLKPGENLIGRDDDCSVV